MRAAVVLLLASLPAVAQDPVAAPLARALGRLFVADVNVRLAAARALAKLRPEFADTLPYLEQLVREPMKGGSGARARKPLTSGQAGWLVDHIEDVRPNLRHSALSGLVAGLDPEWPTATKDLVLGLFDRIERPDCAILTIDGRAKLSAREGLAHAVDRLLQGAGRDARKELAPVLARHAADDGLWARLLLLAQDRDAEVRACALAAAATVEDRDDSAAHMIVGAMTDREPRVRAAAFRALLRLPFWSDVLVKGHDLAIAALDDPSLNVVRSALFLLAGWGTANAHALPAVKKHLDHGDGSIRHAALYAWWQMAPNEPAAVFAVLERLRTDNWPLRLMVGGWINERAVQIGCPRY